jgi:hypothetical protein
VNLAFVFQSPKPGYKVSEQLEYGSSTDHTLDKQLRQLSTPVAALAYGERYPYDSNNTHKSITQ